MKIKLMLGSFIKKATEITHWVFSAFYNNGQILFAIPICLALNFLLPTIFRVDYGPFNKGYSVVLQIAGAFTVLYSINSNLQSISGYGIFQMMGDKIKSLFSPDVSAEMEAESVMTVFEMTGNAKEPQIQKIMTTEDKIENLQKQINELEKNIQKAEERIDEKINTKDNKYLNTMNEIHQQLNNIKTIPVDGVETQIFGTLLMIYGLIVGYLT